MCDKSCLLCYYRLGNYSADRRGSINLNNKNKYQTKYTFKGSKVENKYSNIFEDLNQKEELYSSNSLKKIHEGNEPEEKKNVLREVSPEEARENSQNRTKIMRHEKEVSMRKSSPIVASKKYPNFDIDGNIKNLSSDKFNIAEYEEGFDIEKFLRENGDISRDDLFNDPDYIHKKAKERAKMDKSGVEIYKEYSDFEAPAAINEDDISKNQTSNEEIGSTIDLSNISIDGTGVEEEEVDPTKFSLRHKVVQGEGDIKSKEEEIEELLRRIKGNEKKEKTDRIRTQRTQKKTREAVKNVDNSSSGRSVDSNKAFKNRADVYKRNNKSRESRISFKKLFATLIIAVVLVFICATAYNYYTSTMKDKAANDEKNKTVVTETSKDKNSGQTQNSAEKTKAENIKKLEALKSKLNSTEVDRLDYIIKNIDSYPASLISLLTRNSETVDYVYSYKDKDSYNSRDLSSVTSSYQVDGDVPLFLQWDRRWGYRIYGKEVLGLSGCGPTSLAMVIKHFDPSSNVNPFSVAEYSSSNGYLSKDNFTSWSLFEKGLANFGLKSFDVVPVEAKMKKALDDGNLLIVSVKQGVFTEVGHIFVIRGYDSEGNFLINDPNSIQNSNKAWSFDELKGEIRKIWAINSIDGSSSSGTSSSGSNENSSSSSRSDNSSSSSDDPSIIQDIE